LDTSGATFTSENLFFFHKIIKHNLLWIIDIKHINPQKHKLITGIKKQNELSLINFLEKNKKPYWIRQVILPGYTDDPKDLRKLGTFIKSLKWLKNFELLPYHRLAIDKYKALNIHSLTTQIKEPTKQMMAKAKGIIIGN
jgi:pyruvate formate lyase activating enzyme